MKKCLQMILAVLLVAVVVYAEGTLETKTVQDTIKYLLDFVAKSDCTFIRNDEPHTGKEAAEHMKAKYEHFKKKIKTPEDFIRLAASKSLITGKPYLVMTKDGKEIHSDEWLSKVLQDYRESQKKQKSKG